MQPEIRLDLDAQTGPARIWVQQEAIQREIGYIFRKFLRDFADDASGELLYKQRMRDMCTSARPTHPPMYSAMDTHHTPCQRLSHRGWIQRLLPFSQKHSEGDHGMHVRGHLFASMRLM